MDRIVALRVGHLRCFEEAVLPLSRLTVLVGENGSGKSTVIEALEVLRSCADLDLVRGLVQVHGGVEALLRGGASSLRLAVRVEDDAGDEEPLEYEIELGRQGQWPVILGERLWLGQVGGQATIDRSGPVVRAWSLPSGTLEPVAIGLPPERTMLSHAVLYPAANHASHRRMHGVLAGILVHLPFDARAGWGGRTVGTESDLRRTMPAQQVDRLGTFGGGLVNAWAALRNRSPADWERALELLRLGLGVDLEGVNVEHGSRPGDVSLALKREGQRAIWSDYLSDGEVCWLALVATVLLRSPGRQLVLDEPELHLHPSLTVRLTQLLEAHVDDGPILLATHSDRLLDALADPATCVRVCSFGPDRSARVERLDPQSLALWLDMYRGLGEIRAAGHERSVIG